MGLLDGDSNRMLGVADYSGVQPGYAPAGPTNAGPLYDAVTAFLGAMKAAPGAGVQHYYDVMGQPNPLTGGNAQWPGEISNFDKLGTLLQTAGTTSLAGIAGGIPAEAALGSGAMRKVVMRPQGWNAASDEVGGLTRPGHFYRGMTADEYSATLGSGKGINSRADYSTPGEGTSFASDAGTAESYANYGRTDPRLTGQPNYLVEVAGDDGLKLDKDGYHKAAGEIPPHRVTRVFQMAPDNGAVVGTEIPPPFAGPNSDRAASAATGDGGLLGGKGGTYLGAGFSRVIPGMDRLAALASDNAAAARGEYAAGSAAQPFAAMSGETVLPNLINSWHASPYSFDRFDLSKIGTGEGNQAYGQGIYSAESPAVSGPGGQYDRQFTAKNLGQYDLNQQQDSILRALRAGKSDMDILREQASMGADFDQAHTALDQMKAAKAHIYQLAIHADPATLLDWHTPLNKQSDYVRSALKEAGLGGPLDHGASVYQQLSQWGRPGIDARGKGAAAASQYLNDAGIPGISYLDGLSRSIGTGTLGQGTRNTVMFDPNRIEILRKYGLLGGALGGGGLLGGEQQ